MDGTELCFGDRFRVGRLRKHAGPVGEAVHDGGLELADDGAKNLLELGVHHHVLVVAEKLMGEILEIVDSVRIRIFPLAMGTVERVEGFDSELFGVCRGERIGAAATLGRGRDIFV